MSSKNMLDKLIRESRELVNMAFKPVNDPSWLNPVPKVGEHPNPDLEYESARDLKDEMEKCEYCGEPAVTKCDDGTPLCESCAATNAEKCDEPFFPED